MAIKSIHMCALLLFRELSTGELHFAVRKEILKYRGADKSLARPTSRCILFDGENISFDASLVIYI